MKRALILVSVAVAVLLVPSGLATHGSRVWSGQWTTNTGGVGFRWVTDTEGVKAIKGQGGKPCAEPTDYYRGGYVSGGEAGKVTGCTAGRSHLTARYVPDGAGGSGSFDISFVSPKSFRGSYRTDAGASGPYTGSFKGHFGGDGGETPTCKAPPRTVASTQATGDCEYLVRWSFNQARQPITGDLSVQRTAGQGSFRFFVRQGESLTGEHCGDLDIRSRVVHVHEEIADDIVIEMKPTSLIGVCVRIPSSRPVKSLTVDMVGLNVSVSSDPDCDDERRANIVLRSGKPTDLVTLRVAGCPRHSHAYFPSASGAKDPVSIVRVTIDISPA